MNEQFPQHNSLDEPEREDRPAARDMEASREPEQRPNPRVYVTKGLPLRAELTTGAWLDMARDSQAIYAEMYAVFGEDETYDADRLYIWDHHGFGAFNITTGAIGLEGVDSIELLAQVARGIAEHCPAYATWADAHDDDPRLFDHFDAAYKGHHESMAAYVRQLFEPLRIEDRLKQQCPRCWRSSSRSTTWRLATRCLKRAISLRFPPRVAGCGCLTSEHNRTDRR